MEEKRRSGNREKIMNCAIDLFFSRGYDAVGVQEIVDRAGITKPTLYHYFGSKLGLLEAILVDRVQPLIPLLREASQGEKNMEEVLCDTALAFMHYCSRNAKTYHLFMALLFYAKENEAYQKAIPLITELFDTVIEIFFARREALGNMRGRQEQFGVAFIGVLNNFYLWRGGSFGEDMAPITDDEVREVVREFMYGIFV